MLDPHEVLGIAPGSPPEVVRRAFRRQVWKHHPDLNPRDPVAAERLRSVIDAYQRLERTRKSAKSQAPGTPLVVVCQIRGADLYGVLSASALGSGSDWAEIALHAVDACGICGGAGFEAIAASFWRVERFECEVCRGGGLVRVDRKVRVRIPAAARDGTKLRLRGIGLARPGTTRGDAILFVSRA